MSLYVKYLVCYDISNTRTRSKFFDFLKDLGLTPIQNPFSSVTSRLRRYAR